MDDNRIEIVARLDTSRAAVVKIEADLSKISDQLNKDQALKIIANLDLGKTTQRIQSQLATINKDLKLDIGKLNVDANVEKVVTDIQNGLSKVQKGVSLNVNVDKSAIENIGDSLANIGVDSKNIERLSKYFEQLDVVITKIRPKFVEVSDGVKTLDTLTISGIDKKTGNVVTIVDQLDNIEGKVAKTTTTITQNLAKVEQSNKKIEDSAKAAQLAQNDFLKLQGTADVYAKKYGDNSELKTQFDTIRQIMSEFDDTQPVEKQRETIIKLDNELKKIKVDIDAINKAKKEVASSTASDFYPDIAKIASSDQSSQTAQLDKAKSTLNAFFGEQGLEDNANRIKRAIEDTSGELQRFYVQVEKGDKSVETLTYALNEQGDAYTYLGKTIREADNSTDFRRKDITTQWQIQTENLQKFISNAEKAGAASGVLSDDISNLKAKLAQGGDTSAMNSFLDDFDIAKAKLQAFRAELTKQNAEKNFERRVKTLSANMDSFAAANKRATDSTKQMSSGKTFAEEWVRLSTQMAKGAELTDQEVKDLATDFRIFGKEAKTAGLTGASAFEKFGNAFKLISTYISANQLINMVISKIREAVTELKNIDDILTEISKTSDRSEASLRKLGDSAFDTASKYGRTASDYLLGVQEMSRAGYGEEESEKLAELSLLAQAAGDMTAEMANQYIIATDAAYKLGGSEEKLTKILDSQNYITNHNALSMENLAQATKLAASQAAASGVEIDKLTAAVGTMAAVTQQGGEQSGRAFRGILMNLRMVKATADEIDDGGEAITTESLSKYEKAAADLGVSLKAVRNGTLALRDPMEILRDLAIAVSRESEDSIKVANLLSSVGGKYRAKRLTQCIAICT